MNVAKTIKTIRIKKNMSQRELAEKLGISQSAMSQFEKGSTNPTLETIKKIANALDVPYVDLLEVDSEEFKQFKENRKKFAEQYNNRHKDKMNLLMDQLNTIGQEKAIDQVKMLTKIDEYKK